MIMKALGIQPIPLISAAQTQKEVTTESKVFSIYATGYVHSGKRESSVHIHAVVDFRGAPTPAQIAQQLLQQLNPNGANGANGATGTVTPPPVTGATQGPGSPASGTQTGIQGALKPGSGGNIVYYRVD
jgi:general secretion pathway protein K